MHTMRIPAVLLLVAPFFTLLSAQSTDPSPTPRRRSISEPLPTSLDQITDPALLEILSSRLSAESAVAVPASRSRARKIKGFGHQADHLPLSNAERIRIGLPLKPPVKKARGGHTFSEDGSTMGENPNWDSEEDLGNWLDHEHAF